MFIFKLNLKVYEIKSILYIRFLSPNYVFTQFVNLSLVNIKWGQFTAIYIHLIETSM